MIVVLSVQELRDIAEVIHNQLHQCRSLNVAVSVAILSDPKLTVQWQSNEIVLSIQIGDSISISPIPEWLRCEFHTEHLKLFFPEHRLTEIEYLLRKSVEAFLESGAVDPNRIVLAALRIALQTWTGAGEPMPSREQLGLLGELSMLVELSTRIAPIDLVNGWDETSRAPLDFNLDDGRMLEAKVTSPNSTKVEATSLYQFVADNYPIILGVTQITPDATGTTLPDLVSKLLQRLDEIEKSGVASRLLKNKVRSRFPLIERREYFRSKWKIHGFSSKIVDANSTAATFPSTVPTDVTIQGFSFDFKDYAAY